MNILTSDRKVLLVILGILFFCAWGFLIYSNSLHSPFQFDDMIFLVQNDSIKNLKNISFLWNDVNLRKRFVVFSSFAVNYYFSGTDPFGYHCVNMVIHIMMAISVWWLMLLIYSFEDRGGPEKKFFAFAAAVLFLVHPIQTEAVTYISQRFTSLAALFYVLSVCFYIFARKKIRADGIGLKSIACFFFAAVFALSGSFSKEIVFSLPLMFLLIEIVFFPENRLRKILCFCGLCFLCVWAGLTLFRLPLIISWPYFFTQMKVIVLYIGLLFLPLWQNLDHDIAFARSFWNPAVFAGFFVLLSIGIAGISMFRRNRIVSLGIFWFFIALAIESSFFPILDAMAERRLYLPSIGFFMILMEVFRKFSFRWAVAVVCLITAVFSILTFQRNVLWQDEFAMWQDVVKKSPNKERAYHNIGFYYLKDKDYKRAIEYFSKVIDRNPRHFLAYHNRANAYRAQGKYGLALIDCAKAKAINPEYSPVFFNCGIIYDFLGEYDKAIQEYTSAIRFQPNFVNAYFNRGKCYQKIGRTEKALRDYTQALYWDPGQARIYNRRGLLLANLGRLEEALQDYQKVITLDPRRPDVYNNRALIFFAQKRYQEALRDYDQAILLNLDYPEAYHNRGNLRWKTHDDEAALQDFNRALSLKVFPQTLLSRSQIYLEKGQYDLAVKDCDRFSEIFGKNSEISRIRAEAISKLKN